MTQRTIHVTHYKFRWCEHISNSSNDTSPVCRLVNDFSELVKFQLYSYGARWTSGWHCYLCKWKLLSDRFIYFHGTSQFIHNFYFKILLQHNRNSSLILVVLLCEMGYSFALVFIASEFGQLGSTAFIEIDYKIGRFDWYEFHMEIQKILPMITIVTQKPVGLEVFGSFTCDRENFEKVSQIAIIIKSLCV